MARKRTEGESGDRGTVSVGSRRSNRRWNDRTADSVHIADDRRRDLLRYLAAGSSATVSKAARQIAAWDRKVAPAEVGDEQRDRVRDHLLRNHIPRLQACGLVTYDEATETIRLTDCGRRAVTK